jgi:hypothetical protein
VKQHSILVRSSDPYATDTSILGLLRMPAGCPGFSSSLCGWAFLLQMESHARCSEGNKQNKNVYCAWYSTITRCRSPTAIRYVLDVIMYAGSAIRHAAGTPHQTQVVPGVLQDPARQQLCLWTLEWRCWRLRDSAALYCVVVQSVEMCLDFRP